jgi:RNA polymerase sigma-70 factor (ECF subfamily)
MNAIGPSSPDERELMRSLHEGSMAALGALYRRTAPYLYPLAVRIVGSRERACAVIEDLFEEIWRDRARWKSAVEIPAVDWISRCRELALAQTGPIPRGSDPRHPDPNHPRRPMMEPIAPAPVLTAAPPAAGGALSDPRLVAREALSSLPENDRRALEEAYFHGAHAREVAVVIGAATSDAAMILRSALVRFREHIAERGQVAEGEAAPAATGSAS